MSANDVQRQNAYNSFKLLERLDDQYLRGGHDAYLAIEELKRNWPSIRDGQAWAAKWAVQDDMAVQLCVNYPIDGSHILTAWQEPGERVAWLESALATEPMLADSRIRRILLSSLGDAYNAIGAYQKALDRYKQALEIPHSSPPTQADLLVGQGQSYLNMGQPTKALQCYEQALSVADPNDYQDMIGVHSGMGSAYLALGEVEQARDVLQLALKVARHYHNFLNEGLILSGLGIVYMLTNAYDKALVTQQQALNIISKINYNLLEPQITGNIGVILLRQGRFLEAHQYTHQALQKFEALGQRQHTSIVLSHLGVIELERGRLTEAVDYFKRALAITREFGEKRTECHLLNNLSLAHVGLEELPPSREYAEQALELARQHGLPQEETLALGNLAAVCHGMGAYQQALEHGLKALSKSYYLANQQQQGAITLIVGFAYLEQKMYHKAISYLKKGLELIDVEREPNKHIKANFHQGMAYINLNKLEKAIYHCLQALRVAQKINDLSWQLRALVGISYAYSLKQEFNKAITSCQEGLALLPADQYSLAKARLLQTQGLAHLGLMQFQEALACLQQARAIFQQFDEHDEVATLDETMAKVQVSDSNTEMVEEVPDEGLLYLERGEFAKALDHYQAKLAQAQVTRDKHAQAVCLVNLGMVYYRLKKYTEAIDHLQQSIAFYHEAGTPNSEPLHQLIAAIRTEQASVQRVNEQNLAGAIMRLLAAATLHERQEIIQQNPALLTVDAAIAFDQVRHFFHDQPARIEPLNQLEQTLQLAQLIGVKNAFAEKKPFSDDVSLQALGDQLRNMDDYENPERRIALAKQALELMPQPDHPLDWAFFNFQLGMGYVGSASQDRAQNLEKAIYAFERSLQVVTRNQLPRQWAEAVNMLGVAYAHRGYGNFADNLEKSIHYFKQALEVVKKETASEFWAGMKANLATSYLRRIDGDLVENQERGLQYYEETLELIRPDNMPNQWVRVMHQLGNLYPIRVRGIAAENQERAISYYNRGLQVARRYPQMDKQRAIILNGLATTYVQRQRGNPADNIEHAIKYYEEALEVLTPDKPAYWTQVTIALAQAYVKRQYGNPIENQQHAVHLLARVQHTINRESAPQAWALCMYTLGEAYQNLSFGNPNQLGSANDNIKPAAEAYEEAAKVMTLETWPLRYFMIKFKHSILYLGHRDWQKAHENLAEALKAKNILYQSGATPQSRQEMLKMLRQLPADDAYCLAKMGRFMEAVERLEQGKARALSEVLARNEAALEAAKDELRTTFIRLRGHIAMLEAEARAEGQPGAREFLVVSSELSQARSELNATIERIREDVPEFMPQGLDSGGIASVAKDLNQPLVYLLTTSFGSLALIVPPICESKKVVPIWLDDFQSPELSNILHQKDGSSYLHGTVGANIKVLKTVLEQIRPRLDHLMLPIATRLTGLGYQQGVLIPTGTLSLLPLHAVCPQLNLTVAPSARALQTALDRQKERAHLPATLLGIGNPLPNPKPLAFARLEVEEIAPLFPNQNTFYEKSATRTTTLNALPGATHLHFSCHGAFNSQQPLDSTLYLAGSDTLTLRDLLDGGFDLSAARLAVLSACQTGITDFQNVPDEAIGFPAGFLQAGVPGVISTLWPVNDISTALLLARFYRYHLEDGLAPATALHKAQKWLREASIQETASYLETCYRRAKSAKTAQLLAQMKHYRHRAHKNPSERPFEHPYYWAAFVFSGV